MIISSSKPFSQILSMLEGKKNVFIVGCNVCAAKLHVGGEDEVNDMARSLEKEGFTITGTTVAKAACSVRGEQFLEDVGPAIKDTDAVLVMACGSGTSNIARFVDVEVYPANNTDSLGAMETGEVLNHLCAMCGDCTVWEFGGVCPQARCPKQLLNGPCGGSIEGKCEVDPEKECVWELIYARMEKLGKTDMLEKVRDPKEHQVR